MNITLALKHHQLDLANAAQMRRIELETSTETTVIEGATAGGDEEALRGVPALAYGVGGAQRGSRPGTNTARQALAYATDPFAAPRRRAVTGARP